MKAGFECGIGFEKFNDIKVGDLIEVFVEERVAVVCLDAGNGRIGLLPLMSQGSRPDRVADQIRSELAQLLAREVHDPGIGFVTLTRVQISARPAAGARVLHGARRREDAREIERAALERAAPFLRRQIGSRLRLKRTPELHFIYDESIEGQDRIEQLLNELQAGPHPAAHERQRAPLPSSEH